MKANELYHYGVLGMKWGVRRYQPYGTGGYNPKRKGIFRRHSSDAMRRARKTNVNDLDDNELNRINNRLRSESEFKKLTSRVDEGKKKARRLMIYKGAMLYSAAATSYAFSTGQLYMIPILQSLGAVSLMKYLKESGSSKDESKVLSAYFKK